LYRFCFSKRLPQNAFWQKSRIPNNKPVNMFPDKTINRLLFIYLSFLHKDNDAAYKEKTAYNITPVHINGNYYSSDVWIFQGT